MKKEAKTFKYYMFSIDNQQYLNKIYEIFPLKISL